jgi:hypothetical protein
MKKNMRLATTNAEGSARASIVIYITIAIAITTAIIALVRLDTTGKRGSGLSEEFTYDLTDLGRIDPNLILYEEPVPAIDTGFSESHSISVSSEGLIYAAGDNAIRKFSESGDLLGEINLADAPQCLAAVDDGKIYIGMKDHVQVYDGGGKRLGRWPSLGDDAVLTSIAVSKNDVFVADAGNRIVHHFDTTGKLIKRIGGKDKDKNIPGFVVPSPYFDLAVGHDGLLRVTNPGNHRIEAYTREGDLEFWWGTFSSEVEGFCGCCNPINFAILPDESFVTCEKGLARIKIYDPEGTFVCVVAGPEQLLEGGVSRVSVFGPGAQAGAFDLSADGRGRIFVLDTIMNTVRTFTKIKAK